MYEGYLISSPAKPRNNNGPEQSVKVGLALDWVPGCHCLSLAEQVQHKSGHKMQKSVMILTKKEKLLIHSRPIKICIAVLVSDDSGQLGEVGADVVPDNVGVFCFVSRQ